jgi:hypothetical protein
VPVDPFVVEGSEFYAEPEINAFNALTNADYPLKLSEPLGYELNLDKCFSPAEQDFGVK